MTSHFLDQSDMKNMLNDIVHYVFSIFVYRLMSHVADVNSHSSISKFLFIQL